MGRFSWLGGSDNRRDNDASVRRARAHRRSIPRTARDAERWEDQDRQRFGAGIFRRR